MANPVHQPSRSARGGEEINKFWAVVQLLVENGADVKSPNSSGGKSLFAAANNGHEAVVKLLLEAGVNINTQEYGNALQDAAYNDKEVLV
jgi:ankyrin repeat protein